MALEMSNATYARSRSGTDKIKSNLDGDIKNIKTALNGDALQNMLKVFSSYWVGSDHDAFEKDVKARVKTIENGCTEIQRYIDEALEADYKDFISKQKTFYK
jgi:hypothetical protein